MNQEPLNIHSMGQVNVPINSAPEPIDINNPDEISDTAREAIGQINQRSTNYTWDINRLKLDRHQLQQDLIKARLEPQAYSLNPLFRFFQYLIFKIQSLFKLIGKKPPERINYQILSSIVRAIPEEGHCPQSIVLSYTHEYLKRHRSLNELNNDMDKNLEENIGKAAVRAKQIEKLQKNKNLKANAPELLKVISSIKQDLGNLEVGNKLLLPGGWQTKAGFSEAIYEIEKHEDESYTIQVLSLDEEQRDFWVGEKNLETEKIKYNPFLKFENVSLADVNASIESLIHIQLPQMYAPEKTKDRGFFGERLEAMKKMYAEDGKQSVTEYFTPLDIMHEFYKMPPQPSDHDLFITIPKTPNFSKTLLTYIKSVTPEHYKSAKIELELSAFFDSINQDSQAFLKNQSLRDVAQVSARRLILELETNKEALDLNEDIYTSIIQDLKDIVILAQKLDLKTNRTALPSIKLTAFNESFKLPEVMKLEDTQKEPLKSYSAQEVEFIQLEIPKRDDEVNFDAHDIQNFINTIKNQQQVIQNLCNNENDYKNVEALVLDIARQLPPPISSQARLKDVWTALNNNQIQEMQNIIYDFSQYLFDAQQAQISPLNAEKMIANANFIAIADRLTVLQASRLGDQENNPFMLKARDMNGFRSIVYFDPQEIKTVLSNDTYLRAIPAHQHRLAEDILNYWNACDNNARQWQPRAMIKLDHGYIKTESNDFAYLAERFQEKNPHKNLEWNDIYSVFHEIEVEDSVYLPPAIIQQRKMHLMMKGMLWQEHTFNLTKSSEFIKLGNQLVNEAGGNVNALSQQEIWQRIWKLKDQKIKNCFQNNQPKINSKSSLRPHIKWTITQENEFILQPSGVEFDVKNYKSWKKWHSSEKIYKDQGRYLDSPTDKRLVNFKLGIQNQGEEVLTQQSLIQHSHSEEEMLLRSMQTEDYRLEQTFALFSEHPELLKTPAYQRLFELNMFKQGELLRKIEEQPTFAEEISIFADNNYRLARETRDIDSALFFLELRNNFNDYIQLTNIAKEELFDSSQIDEDYQELLNLTINSQEKRSIYAQMLSYYLHQIENGSLNFKDINDQKTIDILNKILEGYFLYNSLDAGIVHQNSEIDANMERLMIHSMPSLKKMMEHSPLLKNSLENIFQTLKIPFDDIPIEGEFPVYKYGNQRVDIQRGLIFSDNKAKGLLPVEILENENIQRLFKNKKTGRLELELETLMEFRLDPRSGQEIIIYTFKERPDLRIIRKKDSDPVIQMKLSKNDSSKKTWYELCPNPDSSKIVENNPLPFLGEIHDLVLNHFVWRQLDKPSQLIVNDENTFEELYSIQLKSAGNEWKIAEVKRFKDQLVLVNPWTAHKKMGSLTAIEDPKFIKVWAKGSNIKEFEFTRIKLFNGSNLAYCTKEKKSNGRVLTILESVHHKNFTLPYQSAPLIAPTGEGNLGMEQLPHMFRNFNILTDHKKGTKKVLILQQPMVRTHIQKQSLPVMERYAKWSDHAEQDHRIDSPQPQKLLELEIDPFSNTLKTNNKQANLYLSYIFFTNKRYEQALEYLNISETSLPISEEHNLIYQWINQWPDTTAEGIAFKLKAALALKAYEAKQSRSYANVENALRDAHLLSQQYKDYEHHQETLPPYLRLTDTENETYNRMINQTLLTGFVPETLEIPVVDLPATEWKKPIRVPINKIKTRILAKDLFLNMKGNKIPNHEFSLTSNKLFIKNFRALFETIYSSSPESKDYQRVKQVIEFAKLTSTNAKAVQQLLKKFIKFKESHDNENEEVRHALFQDYAFPKNIKRAPFLFLRLNQIVGLTPSLDTLEDFLTKLNALDIQENDAEGAEEVAVDPKAAPSRKMEFDPNQLNPPLNIKERIDFYHTNQLLEEQGLISKESSPEDIVKALKKVHMLDQIAKNRRLEELNHRRRLIDEFLISEPIQAEAEIQHTIPELIGEPILTYNHPLEEFFKLNPTDDSDDEIASQIQETAGFLNLYIDSQEEPSVKRLAQKIQEDTEAYIISSKNKKEVTLDPEANIEILRTSVKQKISEVIKQKYTAEYLILSILKQGHPPLINTSGVEVLKHELKTIPQRLIGLYVDRRMHDVPEILGLQLNEEDIQKLDQTLEKWMMHTIEEKMVTHAFKQLETFDDIQALSSEKISELYEALNPQRYYSIGKSDPLNYERELLAIEFVTGFILRANQVETIHTMLQDPNQVKQLGVGGGKSSIILPMLLHRQADGKHLSMGILPEWLYEIVSDDLDKSSRTLFGQDIFRFEFDRNKEIDQEWLLNQYVNLVEIIKNKNAILTTKTSLLSFRNKFLETLNELESAPNENEREILLEKIRLMADILSLIKERGSAIADELDALLDIRQELNYALGIPEKIEMHKWKMGLKIYRQWIESTEDKNELLYFYANKLRLNEQASLTPEDLKIVQNELAASFYQEWKDQLKISEKDFCDYIVEEDVNNNIALEENVPLFMMDLKESNRPLYQEIGLLRQYISKTLPNTLSHSSNVHYGRAADGTHTIPYKANNTPSQAEFGEEFERIGHYIQDYIQNGLNPTQLHVWIHSLLTQINAEMMEHYTETGSVGDMESSPSYQAFFNDFPDINLTQISHDSQMFSQFLSELNKNEETKLKFLENWVFPLMEVSPLQISSNPLDLVSMIGNFSGFTGTPWNVDTYHSKIQSEHAHAAGTDGKFIETLMRLYSHGEDLTIKTLPIDVEHPLESILDQIPNFLDRYDAFIDAGAYLKGIDNSDVVEILSKYPTTNKKAVLHITTTNEKVIQTLGKDDIMSASQRPDIAMNERLTYYDQAHRIGTDIPHEKEARAGLTVDKMQFKDFAQSVGRMRKAAQGQKFDILLSEDIKKLIITSRSDSDPNKNSPHITIQDIILFTIKNQALREAEDNFRAERLKLTGLVPDTMFWQLIAAYKERDEESAAELYPAYKNELFKRLTNDYDSLTKVIQPENPHIVLNEIREERLHAFEIIKEQLQFSPDVAEHFLYGLEDAIESLKNQPFLDQEKLPAKTAGVLLDAKDTQVQTQQQQEIQVEIQSSPIVVNPNETWSDWFVEDLEQLWLSIDLMKKASEGVSFLDEEIRVTPNFALENGGSESTPLSERLLNDHRIPVAQVLVMQNNETQEFRLVLLDILDYEKVVAPLLQNNSEQPYKAAVFDIRPQKGSLLLRSTLLEHENPWDVDEMEELTKKFVKIKVFNRQVNFYNREEVRKLKEWVAEDPDNLRHYFESHLLIPTLQDKYSKSILYKTFQSQDPSLP